MLMEFFRHTIELIPKQRNITILSDEFKGIIDNYRIEVPISSKKGFISYTMNHIHTILSIYKRLKFY